MAERNVGSVVVVKDGRPLGIVTDRDLALRVLGRGRSGRDVRARSIMTTPLLFVRSDASPEEAISLMREARVRRLPIVDEGGLLAGIVCLDDLVQHLGRGHASMSDAIAALPRLES
jgi:CBS domain-containing protein